MKANSSNFLEAYSAVVEPSPIQSVDIIGAEAVIATDTFFKDIQNSLDLSPLSISYFFQRGIKMLVPAPELFAPISDSTPESKDYIDFFRVVGGQVLASATLIRDEQDYQIAHFSKFPLLDTTQDAIRKLKELERIHKELESS